MKTRSNPSTALVRAAAAKVRSSGHKLAGPGRKAYTYVPTPLKRHEPRPTPGVSGIRTGAKLGYPDPRVWAEEVRDNPTLAFVRARENGKKGFMSNVIYGTKSLGGRIQQWQGPGTPNANHVGSYFTGGHGAETERVRASAKELRALYRRLDLNTPQTDMEHLSKVIRDLEALLPRDNPTLAQVRAAASRGASAAAKHARSAYAYAAPKARAAAKATAAAAKRGVKRAAPHVARGARAAAARLDEYATRPNPSRAPIDHKFAGELFSAGQRPTALAYLRGTLTKGTARALVEGKLRAKKRRR